MTVKSLVRVAALAVALALAVAAGELAVRVIDGYRVFSFRLVQSRVPAVTISPVDAGPLARRHVDALPIADGVRREWFVESPALLPRPPLSPELAAVAEQIRPLGVRSDMFKRWNTRLVQEHVCSGDPFFRQFPGFVFSFEPDTRTPHPPYRFLQGVATPYGLVTNRFGFRGHEIAPDKPAGVIRIAVAGSSTAVGSHGQPFSYPEFLERWLNLWAESQAPAVRFEVINVGREGVGSQDLAAIVREELLPLEPDLIVYHEGGNQFTFGDVIDVEGGAVKAPPDPAARSPLPGANHFALARRAGVLLRRAGSGAEPRKPAYKMKWPAAIDEAHPDPDARVLPLNLGQIVSDLDDIRGAASSIGAQLVVTSFIWMVEDGLVVPGEYQPSFNAILNVQQWPARYADIRRMADFQNRVFRAYADARRVPFMDVGAGYPRDVALFTDPVHMTPDGDRLRAWVMLQQLVPLVRAEIAAKRLARPDREPYQGSTQPAPLQRTLLACDFTANRPLPDALPLAGLRAVGEDSSVTGSHPMRVVTSLALNGYAASAPLAEFARVAGPGQVHVRLRVLSGRVAVGVLKKDQSAFLTYRTVDASPKPVDLYLSLMSLSDAGSLMVSNAGRHDGERAIVEIEDTGVLVPSK